MPSYLIDGPGEIRSEWLDGKLRVGVTAGASAPESLVAQVVEHLQRESTRVVELDGPREDISFSLPVALREKKTS